MESNKELKEIDIKNRTCLYLDNIIKVKDFDFDNIQLSEKLYEKLYGKIFIYDISQKIFYG